jgi:hypothetical protein
MAIKPIRSSRITTGETPHEPAVRPWELELLISGAVAFALLQLPSRLDGWFDASRPRLDETFGMGAFMVYYFGKLILYVLITAFGLHLSARAYWVGLIGLESVFPDGVRWEGTTYGPIVREVYAERIGGLQALIDRTDRFCSVIFSAAFSLVVVFLYSVLVVMVLGGLALGISRFLLGGRYLAYLYFGTLIVYSLSAWLLTQVDRLIGARLTPEGRPRRALRRLMVALYYLSGMSLFGAVWLILLSNLPRRTFYTAFYVMLVGLVGLFLVKDVILRAGAVHADGYALLPEGGSRAMLPEHYESQWRTGAAPALSPSIQSDRIDERYVRLFIPYSPNRLNPAMAERCPGLTGRGSLRLAVARSDTLPTARADSVLACWSTLQPVRLNGRAIRPAFHFYLHPVSGLRGAVAYIPTEGLPAGENVLEVGAAPRPPGASRPPRAAYRIPFWR